MAAKKTIKMLGTYRLSTIQGWVTENYGDAIDAAEREGYYADRAPSSGEPIGVYALRSDAPAGATLHATREEAVAERGMGFYKPGRLAEALLVE